MYPKALRKQGADGKYRAQRYQGKAQKVCGPCCGGGGLCCDLNGQLCKNERAAPPWVTLEVRPTISLFTTQGWNNCGAGCFLHQEAFTPPWSIGSADATSLSSACFGQILGPEGAEQEFRVPPCGGDPAAWFNSMSCTGSWDLRGTSSATCPFGIGYNNGLRATYGTQTTIPGPILAGTFFVSMSGEGAFGLVSYQFAISKLDPSKWWVYLNRWSNPGDTSKAIAGSASVSTAPGCIPLVTLAVSFDGTARQFCTPSNRLVRTQLSATVDFTYHGIADCGGLGSGDPGDAGDPIIIDGGLGPRDPRVQRTIDLQARGGGCEGCGG